MIYKEIPIQVEGSDKTSRAQFYILDTLPDEMKIQKRPIILICPGGGYHKVSYREGEPLAMHFLSLGYHAYYSILCHRRHFIRHSFWK